MTGRQEGFPLGRYQFEVGWHDFPPRQYEPGVEWKLLSKALAKAFPFLLACSSLKSTDLGMGAACDTTGTRKVGGTEMKEDRVVRGQVAWRKPEGLW